MGHAVAACAKEDSATVVAAGIDISDVKLDFPVYRSFGDVKQEIDVVIDFSNPALLDSILDFCLDKNIPVVFATTGYSNEQIAKIKTAANKIPVFFTFNFSIGINLLCSLAKSAAAVLGDNFDIEIVEKHHNQKIDAPSGTAIMLANAVNEQLGDSKIYEYDRHSKRQKRDKSEIGIHSIRGGTIVGEHDVIFAGHDEVITLSHSASSKGVFAAGALRAAKFLSSQSVGLYDMSDVIGNR